MFGNIKLIAGVLIIAAVAFFVWDYTNTKAENERLNNELTAANTTIEKLDAKVAEEQRISDEKDAIIRRIRNAPKDQDGPIAPILRNTIIELQDIG